jgi:peptide/nickel transport system substrate-binding protein
MGEVYSSFKIGNIDFIHTNSIEYKEYIGSIGYNIKEYKGRELDFISFNCKDQILSEKEVRKAIGYAIDKTQITSNVYNNQYYISDFPLDYGNYTYNKENVSLGYNAEQAKKVLSDAGWKYQNNKWKKINSQGKTVTLSFDFVVQASQESRIKVAEEIKKQLEEIGIIINIKKVTDSEYLKCLKNKNYEMILTGISNGFSPDLEYFYGNDNIAQYENEEVSAIIEEARNTMDTNVIVEKYNKLSQIVDVDMPYICLYRNKEIILLNTKLSGEIVPSNYNIFNKFWTWCKQK